MRQPADADRIAVADRGGRGIETRLPGRRRLAARPAGSRLIAIAGEHRDLINFRGYILRQVVQQDGVNARSGISRVNEGVALYETRRRNLEFRIGGEGDGEINARPGSPVAIGVVHVSAASI